MNIFGNFETREKINISIEYFREECKGDELWDDRTNFCVKMNKAPGSWHSYEDMRPFLELDYI